MLERGIRSLTVLVGTMLLAITSDSFAAPMRATFRVFDVLGNSPVAVADLPSTIYTVDIDLTRQAVITLTNGTTQLLGDEGQERRFFVDLVTGNYVHLGDVGPMTAANYQLGSWAVRSGENVWGSGPTYGSFHYETRVMLGMESDTDLVQIDGFWATQVVLEDINSFLTPNAMWKIYDRDFRADGREYFGSFSAELLSIEPVVGSVPTPATFVLLVTGLGLAALTTRRRKASPLAMTA